MSEDPVRLRRRLRCPRCHKAPSSLIETTTVASYFDVLDDGASRSGEGYHEPCGGIRLDAACSCGHRWRIKGEIQVTGLDAPATA